MKLLLVLAGLLAALAVLVLLHELEVVGRQEDEQK